MNIQGFGKISQHNLNTYQSSGKIGNKDCVILLEFNKQGQSKTAEKILEVVKQGNSINDEEIPTKIEKDKISKWDKDSKIPSLDELKTVTITTEVQLIQESISSAKDLYNKIYQAELKHDKKVLDYYHKSQNKNTLYNQLNDLRKEYNQENEVLVEGLQKELHTIATEFNKLTNKKDRQEMEEEINSLNHDKMKRFLSTASHHPLHEKVMLFCSTVEKQFSLTKRKDELQSKNRNKKEEKELKDIERELNPKGIISNQKKRAKLEGKLEKLKSEIKNSNDIEKIQEKKGFSDKILEILQGIPRLISSILDKLHSDNIEEIALQLAKNPDGYDLKKIKISLDNEIDELMEKEPELLSPKDAAKAFSKDDIYLMWGRTHLNTALSNPSNWVNKQEVSLVVTKNGNAHVFVKKVEPQKITKENGGVPSGLRKNNKRAANMQKTTLYRLDENGQMDDNSKEVRWRIGQYSTVEAAKDGITTMLENHPKKITSLHDNMLLTPTWFVKKKDYSLAPQHKKNAQLAFQTIIEENSTKIVNNKKAIKQLKDKPQTKKRDKKIKDLEKENKELLKAQDGDNNIKVEFGKHTYTLKELKDLRNNLMQTNFGVNEGAMGKIIAGIKFGWHTSVGKFTDTAIPKTNKTLFDKLNKLQENLGNLSEEQKKLLDKLPAVIQVGQDLEAIWANNDFHTGEVGDNPVKAPSLWSVLDTLLDVTVNTHCMSAKDRGSIVEAHANVYLEMIEANLIDHKKELADKIAEWEKKNKPLSLSEKEKELLITGAFTWKTVESILENSKDIEGSVNAEREYLITYAKQSLGVDKTKDGFLQQKIGKGPDGKISTWKKLLNTFSPNDIRISTNIPLIKKKTTLPLKTPQLAPESIYSETKVNELLIKSNQKVPDILLQRQRYKKHFRLSLQMAMAVTRENTSIPGDKMKGGKPLNILYSGFNRGYVIYKLLNTQENELEKVMTNAMGLEEISEEKREDLIEKAKKAFAIKDLEKQKKAYLAIIKEVEKIKYLSFRPAVKVAT